MKFLTSKSGGVVEGSIEPSLIKELVKKLELLHWKGKDFGIKNPAQLKEFLTIWGAINCAISANPESNREFIRRGGLNWVFWYVVEKKIVLASTQLENVFKELMTTLSTVMGDEGQSDFKTKNFRCQKQIMEQLKLNKEKLP